MIEPIDALLTGWIAPGVWASAELPDAIDNRARSMGWFPIIAEVALATKGEFLAAMRDAAQFPDWVGNNWDAFEDAITDLSWLPGGDILIVLRSPLPDTAVDILVDAARFWDRRGRRFAVAITGPALDGRVGHLARLDHVPMMGQSPPKRPSGQ